MVEVCIVTMWENFMGVSKLFRIVVATGNKNEARKAAAAEIRAELRRPMKARDIPMANIEIRHLLPGSAIIL